MDLIDLTNIYFIYKCPYHNEIVVSVFKPYSNIDKFYITNTLIIQRNMAGKGRLIQQPTRDMV
ncbi:hypothetical protein MAR_004353 [Mya arenaria]|uniref:Uncharacterized protein n=1 Tax=Mya arenaria TaxID=6604 RepID=A0ABY7EWA9_MYAAR|nr:hypothetical protein MAR_004353 [Mya arenaria]